MKEVVSYKVEGLDCAEEVALLQKAVGGRKGVAQLDFDIINARMDVTYESAEISNEMLVEAVRTAGMRAVPWETRKLEKPGNLWQLHGRLIMAALSGILILAGILVHWAMHRNLLHALHIGEMTGEQFPLPVILLYVAAIVTGAWFVLPKAVVSARQLRPDMNLLMTIAVIGAVAIGEWLEAGMVAFLFGVALLLEQWSVGRARNAITALMDLSPPTANTIDPETGKTALRPVEAVHPDEHVLLRPGERIPLDGIVAKGMSDVNQAPITGESMPVAKKTGDEVFAGTINGDGSLEIIVTKNANDTTLARIIHMVSEAHARRAPSEQWVEKFARWYTPLMIALALGVFVFPPLVMNEPWPAWLYRALVILVIACPCALVISTPVSIVSGLTAAARNGVLIKGGVFLESAGHLDALAMDKTGTLTHGHPAVQRVVALAGHTRAEVLDRAAALEAHSEHPVARAILRAAVAEGITSPRAELFTAIKGEGAEGLIGGRPFWIGSHRMMDRKGQETPESHGMAEALEDAGHSVVALGNDKHVCGLISVADAVRPQARAAVADLRSAGIRHVIMLTGDNEGTASAVAGATGVDEYRAELLPQDKVSAVEDLVRKYEHVAMVGDGVNDAPAMAVSTMGIAMGAIGTDAAIETADVALMSDDLSRLAWLIRHSRRTLAIIKQNIFIALGLKLAFMTLAVLGVATLWMAIAADMGASLLVIFNGLRLLGRNQ